MRTDRPVLLGPNHPKQAYAGGGRGARFRGLDPGPSPEPEDWLASVTARWGQDADGLTRLPDGRYLREAISKDPEAFLGPDHLERYGPDPGLLVKLLDAAERLVVHCHPDRDFARRHLGCAHGKTEAWVVLEADPGAEVFLAFDRPVERAELDAWVADQRVDQLLGALHPLAVQAGSAILVPAGVPHAIGPGVLIVELQEPTDFSVLLERGPFASGDLGLGFDVALGCVDRDAWADERVGRLVGPGLGVEGPVLPDAAAPFFRAERAVAGAGGSLDAGYAVLVVASGTGTIEGDFGRLAVERGATVLVPHAAGPLRLEGTLEAVVCRPPAPDAPSVARPVV